MNGFLIAQAAILGTVGWWVMIAIVVAAIVGIGLVAMHAAGVSPPPWAVQIFWIVVVALVAIVAIKLLLSAVG